MSCGDEGLRNVGPLRVGAACARPLDPGDDARHQLPLLRERATGARASLSDIGVTAVN